MLFVLKYWQNGTTSKLSHFTEDLGRPWQALAPLRSTVEIAENGRKTVAVTVPLTVRCTVYDRLLFLAFRRYTVITVIPLKTVPFRDQLQR